MHGHSLRGVRVPKQGEGEACVSVGAHISARGGAQVARTRQRGGAQVARTHQWPSGRLSHRFVSVAVELTECSHLRCFSDAGMRARFRVGQAKPPPPSEVNMGIGLYEHHGDSLPWLG